MPARQVGKLEFTRIRASSLTSAPGARFGSFCCPPAEGSSPLQIDWMQINRHFYLYKTSKFFSSAVFFFFAQGLNVNYTDATQDKFHQCVVLPAVGLLTLNCLILQNLVVKCVLNHLSKCL